MKSSAISVFAALVISGCAAGPSVESINRFGMAGERAVGVLSDSALLEREMAIGTATLNNTCRFIGPPFERPRLAGGRAGSTPELIVAQGEYLSALEGYMRALASASDPQSIANLQSAASGLGQAASGLFAVAPNPAGAAVGTIVSAGLQTTVAFTEFGRQRQIREIASSVDNALTDGLNLIANDAMAIERELERRLAGWNRAASCVLDRLDDDPGTAAQLFARYDTTKRSYRARIVALREGVDIMSAVVVAHDDIVHGENPRQAIADLNFLIDQITTVNAAIENL